MKGLRRGRSRVILCNARSVLRNVSALLNASWIEVMTKYASNYEDVRGYALDPDREQKLLEMQRECTFIWTNKQGEPVGVIMSYLESEDGHLWLTGSEQRARFPAIKRDPRTCIVVSSAGTAWGPGKTLTYKGTAHVHDKADRRIKDWFYPAFARKLRQDQGEAAVQQFIQLLDSPNRVVIEFTPTKKILFDGDKKRAATPPLNEE
jgi:general stress protein 26